jgi:hypothetical protein
MAASINCLSCVPAFASVWGVWLAENFSEGACETTKGSFSSLGMMRTFSVGGSGLIWRGRVSVCAAACAASRHSMKQAAKARGNIFDKGITGELSSPLRPVDLRLLWDCAG